MGSKSNPRWIQRFQNYSLALKELEEACSLKKYSKLERSGLIQTFEFTFELAWKTLGDFLHHRGYPDISGPRPVLEQAFKDGIIHNGEQWMQMLTSRNLSTHSYAEKTAETIAIEVKTIYFPLFKELSIYLESQKSGA